MTTTFQKTVIKSKTEIKAEFAEIHKPSMNACDQKFTSSKEELASNAGYAMLGPESLPMQPSLNDDENIGINAKPESFQLEIAELKEELDEAYCM